MMTQQTKREEREAFYATVLDRSYQPNKADMEFDIGVDVTPERLAQAALRGGAPRREE